MIRCLETAYQANKDEIHKFLNFLMDRKSNEYPNLSDDESD